MIYKFRFSPEFIVQHLVTGSEIRAACVIDGLPKGCRLFAVFPNRHGDWEALFEGPHDAKTEGVTEGKKITFKSIGQDLIPACRSALTFIQHRFEGAGAELIKIQLTDALQNVGAYVPDFETSAEEQLRRVTEEDQE